LTLALYNCFARSGSLADRPAAETTALDNDDDFLTGATMVDECERLSACDCMGMRCC